MLKEFTVTNFKSLKNATAEFPRFCGIIGPNAAGKSNMVQAIGFVRDLFRGNELEFAQMRVSLIPRELFFLGESNTHGPLRFQSVLQLDDSAEYRYTIDISLADESGAEEGDLYISHEKLEQRRAEEWQRVYDRSSDGLVKTTDETPPLSLPRHQLAGTILDDAARVRQFFTNSYVVETGLIRSSFTRPRIGSDPISRLIVEIKKTDPKAFEQFKKIVKRLIPSVAGFEEIISEKPSSAQGRREDYLLMLREENLSEFLSLALASEGDYRTMYLTARALAMQNDSLLVIEEIENGLHPGRLFELLEQLKTIAVTKNLQLLFTTHSPMVIDRLSPSELVYVMRKDAEGSKFVLLSKSEQATKIQAALKEGGKMTDIVRALEIK